MRGTQTKPKTGETQKIKALVTKLNQYRYEYYNLAAPSVSDAAYDRLYDELQKLEKEMGIIYGNSPTQTVGYMPVSSLKKVRHTIPLLSLDKTKQTEELVQMAGKASALLMLKLDGLTIKPYSVLLNGSRDVRGRLHLWQCLTRWRLTAVPYRGRVCITLNSRVAL